MIFVTTNKDLNGQFIEEFNLVQDNANKLIVGEKYSYPKLMELLKLPIKKGECRTSQIKRIQHYIQWDTKTKVYSGIIEDAIPVLKKTNTSAYYELVKDCLLFKLQEFIEEHPNVPYLYLSYDRAIYMCDLVSEGFLLTKTFDGSEIAGALLGISGNFIRKYREQLRKDAISITNNTLKNMKKDNLIYYEECILFMEYERDEFNNIVTVTSEEGILEKATHRRASIIEAKALMECKSIVLKQMLPNIEPNKRIFKLKNRNKYEEYRKNVVALLKSEFGINIDSFYDGYEIALNETNTEYNTEYYLQKLSLKNKIKAKMLNCNNAEYRKALECDIFKEGLFGEEVITEANEVIINVTNMMVEDAEINNALKVEVRNKSYEKKLSELKDEIKKVGNNKTASDDRFNDELNALKSQISIIAEALNRN